MADPTVGSGVYCGLQSLPEYGLTAHTRGGHSALLRSWITWQHTAYYSAPHTVYSVVCICTVHAGSVRLWTPMCVLAEARAGCWVSSSITLCLTALGQRPSQNWKHTVLTCPATQQVFRVSSAPIPKHRGYRHRPLCIASSQALRSYFGNLTVLRPYPPLASQTQH